jgi:hypothetical protein
VNAENRLEMTNILDLNLQGFVCNGNKFLAEQKLPQNSECRKQEKLQIKIAKTHYSQSVIQI